MVVIQGIGSITLAFKYDVSYFLCGALSYLNIKEADLGKTT